MPFRVKLADSVRAQLRQMSNTWSALLAGRLRELADLAEIHPVSRAHQGPVRMQMVVDGMQVQYEVDRDRRQLTVTQLTPVDASGTGGASGSSDCA